MATGKFDLVKCLPKQSEKLERLTSTESCKFVIDQHKLMLEEATPDDSKRQQLEIGDNDRKQHSESSTILPDRRMSKESSPTIFHDALSLDGIDQKQNPKRKTVILLESDGKDIRNNSVSPALNDKGYSRSAQLSVLYATMLSLAGVVFPMTEALNDRWLSSHVVGAFLTYLFLGGSLFILYIKIYEMILKRRHRLAAADKTEVQARGNINGDIDLSKLPRTNVNALSNSAEDGPELTDDLNSYVQADASSTEQFAVSQALPKFGDEDRNAVFLQNSSQSFCGVDSDLPDDVYDYITMHHGTATIADFDTNYFVKFGLLIFAVANMALVALRIEGEHKKNNCGDITVLIYPHYLHLVFIIMQTFFLSKDCKLALRKHKRIVNFGLMHLAATNLCVWFRYLVIEVTESVHEADEHTEVNTYSGENITANQCFTQPVMIKVGPYLFPFILEYSLVAMTILVVTYGNINVRVTRELYRSVCLALDKKRMDFTKCVTSENIKHSDYHRHGAFDKSHNGLMLGGMVLAGMAVSMILFFYWKGTGEDRKAEMCYAISAIVLLTLIAVNTIAAMCQLFKFIFSSANSNTLDHGLLLAAANFLLVIELFSLLSAVFHLVENGVDGLLVAEIIESIISIIQAILQVAFINDGMQRVSDKAEDVEKKKGRSILTFLIVLNVAMWVFESFQEKKSDQTIEVEVYGSLAWAVIDSLAHPLELFFYFHSAICLSHMWHHCYKKPENNDLS